MLAGYGAPVDGAINLVPLTPRLEYSWRLLEDTVRDLEREYERAGMRSRAAGATPGGSMSEAVALERDIAFSLEALLRVRKALGRVSGMDSIPEILPSAVPTIRVISARLHVILPRHSRQLSELSVCLGSIVLDAAALMQARFDFERSNKESALLLDEAKLTVSSRMNDRYPNVDTM